MLEVSRRHAMARLNEIIPLADAGFDESLLDISGHLMAASGRGAVKRDVTALGRDHDLVARRQALSEQIPERVAEISLAALAAIIRRRIEHVTTQFNGAFDGASISLIGSLVGRAQVRAEAD